MIARRRIGKHGLEKALDSLVKKMEEEADIIVPIARRGIRALELSPSSEKLFEDGRVLIFDSIRFHAEELTKKKIILFDESVNTGNTLHRLKWNLAKFSAKKKLKFDKKISTASLLVNRNAQYHPNFYSILATPDRYDYISQELHYRILSTGKPLDVDHLIIRIRLPEQEEMVTGFVKILGEKFHARELSHSGAYKGVRMFTIDLNLDEVKNIFSFCIPKVKELPKLFDDGVKKIRIFLKDDIVHLVPIIYPAMEIRSSVHKNTCPMRNVLVDASICDVMPGAGDDDVISQSIVCYNCIVNGLSTGLMSEFLIRLKEHAKYEFDGLDGKSIQVVSHDESKRLIKALSEIIGNCLEKGQVVSIGEGKAEKFKFDGATIKEYVDLNINKDLRLRPEVGNSIVVRKNKRVNELLLKFGVYDKKWNPPPYGLSYNQVYEGIVNIDKAEFSEGMDIALDAGYLKPIMPFDGMEICCENKLYRSIVRLYTTASEDLDCSIDCFLKLITPKG